MLTLSYNINSSIKEQLKELDSLKNQILTKNINPRVEASLAWEAMLDRMYFSMDTVLAGNQVIQSKEKLAKILMSADSKNGSNQALNLQVFLLQSYKDELFDIFLDWKASKNEVTVATVLQMFERLNSLLPKDQKKDFVKYDIFEKSLERLLKYLQSGNDHPVVKSAVSYIYLGNMAPFGQLSNRINLLLTYIFLYKEGYDVRRLLVIEEFLSNPSILPGGIQSALKSGNLNEWLEFFIHSMTLSLEKALRNIAKDETISSAGGEFWDLNERQKKVLKLFEDPGLSVTNRMVQSKFNVSQITASRDLARLADMGLIAPHGKGRSVYYIKL